MELVKIEAVLDFHGADGRDRGRWAVQVWWTWGVTEDMVQMLMARWGQCNFDRVRKRYETEYVGEEESHCQGVLIIPFWVSQDWFPDPCRRAEKHVDFGTSIPVGIAIRVWFQKNGNAFCCVPR